MTLFSQRSPAGSWTCNLRRILLALTLIGLSIPAPLPAQQPPADAAANPASAPPLDLEQQQLQIQRDYEGFEQKLLELGEYMRPSDPERAELLNRTRGQSRELRVLDQMRTIARLLAEGNELGDAVGRQADLLAHMETLLKLLQSEDARDRLQRLIEAYQGDLKDLNKIIGEQKDARAATERGGENQSLQNGQQRVNDRAQELADKIDRRDAELAAEERAAQAESNNDDEPREPGENQNANDKPSDGKPSDSQRPDSDSPEQPGDDSESKPQQSQPGQPSQPGQKGEPGQPGQPGQPSQPGEQGQQGEPSQAPGQQQQQSGEQPEQDPHQQTPGRKDLEQALDNMQKAIEELKQQKRDGASDQQDAALAHLEQMKARLEEILRQLREEEREMLLTQLEARFQEMLRIQLRINADTERLDKVAVPARESRHAARATDLARTQRENALEADRALILLKEEGSSVAFPEAVEQMRDSMVTVAERLDRTDTGETTRLIEQIIVETLDEMILALQRELEKIKQQEQQQQQQQQQEGDKALVDTIAELKMIRSLQNQVNRLTKQIGLDIDGEQAADGENRKLLRDLSRRQQRIQQATYDMHAGKSALGQELRQRSRQQPPE